MFRSCGYMLTAITCQNYRLSSHYQPQEPLIGRGCIFDWQNCITGRTQGESWRSMHELCSTSALLSCDVPSILGCLKAHNFFRGSRSMDRIRIAFRIMRSILYNYTYHTAYPYFYEIRFGNPSVELLSSPQKSAGYTSK